jgi:AcrR family transcriptional regulator
LNRARLLEAARSALVAGEGIASLEAIARDAGVGIGTLYRHFPTREALVEAVYSTELDAVTASAAGLLDHHPADVALRSWMDDYAAFIATKRGMIDTLRAGWASGVIAAPSTRERITATLATMLEAGAQQGVLRSDVLPADFAVGMVGVFLATAPAAEPAQVSRLLDLLVDGARPRP